MKKKRCHNCNKEVALNELKACQGDNCIDKGSAYCDDCIEVTGGGLFATFHCKSCKKRIKESIERQEKMEKNMKTPKGKQLTALRKHFGVSQGVMAEYVGLSLRQYQEWESDRVPIHRSVEILLFQISTRFAPDFASDWCDEAGYNLEIPPIPEDARETLANMVADAIYTIDELKGICPAPEVMKLRLIRSLLAKKLIVKLDNGSYARWIANTTKWLDMREFFGDLSS